MNTAFYDFIIPGMGTELSHFQSLIKNTQFFPAGTCVKRDGTVGSKILLHPRANVGSKILLHPRANVGSKILLRPNATSKASLSHPEGVDDNLRLGGTDLVFGATFKEIYPELKTAMTKFIYKLGADIRIDLDEKHTAFVKKSVRLNNQKSKHLEWIMPYGSVGIICTMTHNADMKCIYIGAFSYLHRLHSDMIDEANSFKDSIVDAITKMDSKLLDSTKRLIRNTKYPSCFDNVVFVNEEDIANSVALVASVKITKTSLLSYEPTLSSIQEQSHLELSENTEDRSCWVCDKPLSSCKC
jgi:hypothetical protein